MFVYVSAGFKVNRAAGHVFPTRCLALESAVVDHTCFSVTVNDFSESKQPNKSKQPYHDSSIVIVQSDSLCVVFIAVPTQYPLTLDEIANILHHKTS